jgi:hypothetical protein
MKMRAANITFAIITSSLMCLLPEASKTQKPYASGQQASAKPATSFPFISYFGGSDVDDCDDTATDSDGYIYLACHSTSKAFPGCKQRADSQGEDMDAYV